MEREKSVEPTRARSERLSGTPVRKDFRYGENYPGADGRTRGGSVACRLVVWVESVAHRVAPGAPGDRTRLYRVSHEANG